MKPCIARALFAFGLAAAAPTWAQAPATSAEARSHILSAFASGADPRLLADGVSVGPALRQHLGAETDSRRVYDALIELSSGKPIRVRALGPGEAVRYASLVGGPGEPLFALEAGDLTLLLQYASRQKRVSFVEQLGGAAPRAAVPAPAKPEPVKEAPAVVVKEAPAVVVPPAPEPPKPPTAQKPKPPPVTQTPAIPAPKPRPRGECVIKPVMSEEDLWNCSGPPSPAAVERPAPPVPAQTSQPPAAPTLQAPPRAAECVIKPVMSDEELRACGVRR